MKRIPNSVVSELIRLVPILIANIPPGQSTRVDNAIRLTKKIINTLNFSKMENQEKGLTVNIGEYKGENLSK